MDEEEFQKLLEITKSDDFFKPSNTQAWYVENKLTDYAQDENTPLEHLNQLLESPAVGVREGLAYNPALPLEGVKKLVRDPYQKVAYVALTSELLSPEELDAYAREGNPKFAQGISYNLNTWPITLRYLYENYPFEALPGLAQNPSTPADILKTLGTTNNERTILDAIASNPSTPLEVLRNFLKHPDKLLRESLGSNPMAPYHFLEALARDKAWTVRWGVALNPNAPENLLERLSQDSEKRVREKVACNPNVPLKVLERLATDPEKTVRDQVELVAKALGDPYLMGLVTGTS